MRKLWVLGLAGIFTLVLAGCGGGSSGPDLFVVSERLSDQTVDGDIGVHRRPGIPHHFAGIDVTNTIPDRGRRRRGGVPRFPGLSQSTDPFVGGCSVGVIEVFVGSVPFGASVPVLLELVDFQPPVLIGSDFFRSLPDPFLPPVQGIPIFLFRPDDAVSPAPRDQDRGDITGTEGAATIAAGLPGSPPAGPGSPRGHSSDRDPR